MAILASQICQQATDISQDKTSVRWTIDEWVRWLNAGQIEIMVHRPDAFATKATITCATGVQQAIPVDGTKLIEVEANDSDGSKRAVRLISREILDAQLPNWRAMQPSAVVKHFMYDPEIPRFFDVYPPASTSAKLKLVYAKTPTPITEPNPGQEFDAVTGDISVLDIFSNALLDYMLYRAYLKDATYAGNASRALAHYNAFAAAMGIEKLKTLEVAPTSQGNPNHPVASSQGAPN